MKSNFFSLEKVISIIKYYSLNNLLKFSNEKNFYK